MVVLDDRRQAHAEFALYLYEEVGWPKEKICRELNCDLPTLEAMLEYAREQEDDRE